MSTITHIPTIRLQAGDTILAGHSTISVDSVEPDEVDDNRYWINATYISGNFDEWDTARCFSGGALWQVLDAKPGHAPWYLPLAMPPITHEA